jgi:hypothetical protein
MGITTFLGKLLIVASIVFEAYLFYADKAAISTFDKQLGQALTSCNCLTPEIQTYVREYLRLVLVGLLASSALTLICRCWSLKLPVFLGLSILLWVEHHEVFRRVPTLALLENTAFWHSLGVIGAIIYLIGAECTACTTKCVKETVPEKKEAKESKKRN